VCKQRCSAPCPVFLDGSRYSREPTDEEIKQVFGNVGSVSVPLDDSVVGEVEERREAETMELDNEFVGVDSMSGHSPVAGSGSLEEEQVSMELDSGVFGVSTGDSTGEHLHLGRSLSVGDQYMELVEGSHTW
jgi:hypothetical protein